MNGLSIGHVFGVDVRLHPSLLIIFAIIVLNLGLGSLHVLHPTWSPVAVWGTSIAAAVLFVVSILLHELAHTVVARAYGLPVNKIVLFLFGGVSNIEREPQSPRAEFLMAVVGPLMSFLLGIVFLGMAAVAASGVPDDGDPYEFVRSLGPLASLGLWLGPVNFGLAVFNLLPGFPLDGGRVFHALVWRLTGDQDRATAAATTVGRVIGAGLVGIGILMAFGLWVPFFGTGVAAGVWLVLIGWFLSQAASASYTASVVGHALDAVHVRDLMTSATPPITAKATVADLVDMLMAGDQRVVPVLDGDHLIGVVALDDLRKVSRHSWHDTPVSSIMTTAADLQTLDPQSPAAAAFRAMMTGGVQAVPVVERDHFLGLVQREDLFRWLVLHGNLPV
jgi:Zn-dependent protease/CBS domain-containing protein